MEWGRASRKGRKEAPLAPRGKSSVGGCTANRDRDRDRNLNMDPASPKPCFAMLPLRLKASHGTRTAQRQDMFACSNRFLDSGSSKVASLFSLHPSAFFL